MLEIMQESEGKVVGFRATGKLTTADFDQVLLPRLESPSRQFNKLRALVYMDANFVGWDLPAAWANTKLDIRFHGDLEKVAIVGAPIWEEWCVRLASLLMKGELRTFKTEQLADAWVWLKS
jgi:hypothetical protein